MRDRIWAVIGVVLLTVVLASCITAARWARPCYHAGPYQDVAADFHSYTGDTDDDGSADSGACFCYARGARSHARTSD